MANDTPISRVLALGAGRVYVLATAHACALEQPSASAPRMAVHALTLLAQRWLIGDVELARGS